MIDVASMDAENDDREFKSKSKKEKIREKSRSRSLILRGVMIHFSWQWDVSEAHSSFLPLQFLKHDVGLRLSPERE